MVNLADVVVGATTDQQALALQLAVPNGDETPYRVESVAKITFGSREFVMRAVTLGRSSSFLSAVGDAILGGRIFDDDSAQGISEARAERQ